MKMRETNPEWQKLLDILYYADFDNNALEEIDDNPIIQQSKSRNYRMAQWYMSLDKDRKKSLMSDLQEIGLIETEEDSVSLNGMKLTEKGFQVVHEMKVVERQERTNRSVMLLTGVLAIIALVEAVSSIPVLNDMQRSLLQIVGLIIGLLVLYFRQYITRTLSEVFDKLWSISWLD